MEQVVPRSREKIPATAIDGVHDDRSDTSREWNPDDGLNWWTNGFWGGMLWMMYHATGKEEYAQAARISEEKMDQCFEQYYGLHHDVGFMWIPTAVADYRLTGNEDSRRRGMHAANLLAGRFNPVGKFIRAWNDGANDTDTRGWAIIDCMLNLNLLYWAYKESRDPRFRQIAMAHADTAMEHFVRGDGSVKHIVEFNPETGEEVCDYGGQGYAPGSSWTRGQSWGLYDDTAAAIAACGLIEIAGAVPELEKELYLSAAVKLLKSLDEKHCDWNGNTDCFLTCCSSAYHAAKHNHSLVYADSYFLEAILKLRGTDFLLW